MNKLICLLIIILCFILTECKITSKSTVTTTSQPLADKPSVIENKPAAPDSTALAIAGGQTVYQMKCKGCHDLPKPSDYGYSEWSDIMVKMSRKAHLSNTETDQVLAYVHAYSKL